MTDYEQASDPTTSSERLRELAQFSPDEATRRAALLNPNLALDEEWLQDFVDIQDFDAIRVLLNRPSWALEALADPAIEEWAQRMEWIWRRRALHDALTEMQARTLLPTAADWLREQQPDDPVVVELAHILEKGGQEIQSPWGLRRHFRETMEALGLGDEDAVLILAGHSTGTFASFFDVLVTTARNPDAFVGWVDTMYAFSDPYVPLRDARP